jgi:hypothetical protein
VILWTTTADQTPGEWHARGVTELDALARRLWTVAEPVHAVTYFAAESPQAYEAAGLSGFWRGYFAGRAAPMGAVGAGPVIATFYNFHPDFVRRAVPEVWNRIAPERVIEARLAGAVAGLRRLVGGSLDPARIDEMVELMRQLAGESDSAGRALFAANLELEWPDDPVAALWHGATLAREHRGDGHVAALVEAELDGCEAHVLRLAVAGHDGGWVRTFRGWSDDDWDAAVGRLAARGLMGSDSGEATERGRALIDRVEATTDRLAARPLGAMGDAAASRLVELLTPLATAVAASEAIPFPNPIGIPPPGE